MSMITDTIMEQMSMAGKPRVSTMTENIQTGQEQQSNQPMNLGNIALMIMLMMGMGDKNKTGLPGTGAIATGQNPWETPSAPFGLTGSTTPGNLGAQAPPMDFMRMLLSSLGGGR